MRSIVLDDEFIKAVISGKPVNILRLSRDAERCPLGRVGDQLQVLEVWRMTGWDWELPAVKIQYRAGGEIFFETFENDVTDWISSEVEKLDAAARVRRDEDGGLTWDKNDIPWQSPNTLPDWASRFEVEIISVFGTSHAFEWTARGRNIPYATWEIQLRKAK